MMKLPAETNGACGVVRTSIVRAFATYGNTYYVRVIVQ